MAVGEAMPGVVDGPRHHDGWGHGTQKCQGEGEVRLLGGQGPGDHKSRQEGDDEEDRDDPNELTAVVASRVIHLDPPCLTAIFWGDFRIVDALERYSSGSRQEGVASWV